jgi:leucine dehydrogenase
MQGLGVVGSQAVRMLVEEGAEVTVTDIDPEKVAKAVDLHGVSSVAPEDIYDVDAEIFAPYALGAVIDDRTVPLLKARIVAGAANNILAEERHGPALQERGIVYAVDYVANSGGTILDTDRFRKGGFQRERALANVEKIFERTLEVFEIADRDDIGYEEAANRLAERRIEALTGVRLMDRPNTAHYERHT